MNNAGCFDISTFNASLCKYHHGRFLLNAKPDMAVHQIYFKKINSLASEFLE